MLRRLLIAILLMSPGVATAAPAAQFLRVAIQGSFSEVTLGQLIQARGGTAPVRNFGGVLVRDRSHGLRQAQRVAVRIGVAIPPSLTPDARIELNRLAHLKGRAFDMEVRRYMIADHRRTLAEFRAQLRSGDRPTLGYAAAAIPVMMRHLQMAKSIRD